MRRWVLGFCFDAHIANVLLIKKTHPPFLAGKYNGIGGGVEEGETLERAMDRESSEECGLEGLDWLHYATVSVKNSNRGSEIDGEIALFAAVGRLHTARTKTEEDVRIVSVVSAINQANWDVKYMPNIGWMIAMARASLVGVDSCTHFRIEETAWK